MRSHLQKFTLAVPCILASLAGPLRADPIEERNVLSGKVRLEADKGYIYLHGAQRFLGTFLRVPDDETRENYQRDWEKAFAKAQKQYQFQLRRWDTEVGISKRAKRQPPERPPEPDRETFSIDPIELHDVIFSGPNFVYAKSEGSFSYLNSVKPGRYIYYGSVTVNPEGGAIGSCLCMGTIQFDVRPGVVTDLGNYLVAMPNPARDQDYMTMNAWKQAEEKASRTGKSIEMPPGFSRPALSFGLPESLKGWGSIQAEFHASGKMNNYYGVSISRLAPIPQVLGYRRDTVVDLRTNTNVPSPTIGTRAKIKK